MFDLPAVSTIAQTIQLAIAPVFLLAGIGAILNVLAGLAFRVAVAVAFVLGMVLLVAGLVLFLIEINLALSYLYVREELLEREERNWRRAHPK
jgi:uncharacterized membrane protein (Fun14 family)